MWAVVRDMGEAFLIREVFFEPNEQTKNRKRGKWGISKRKNVVNAETRSQEGNVF